MVRALLALSLVLVALVLVALVLVAGAARAAPRALTVGDGSALVIRTYKDGPTARWTHDHVVEATEIAGQATWDPDAPEALAVSVTVQTASLRIDEPAARAKVGLLDAVSDKDRASAEGALKGKETLNVKRYPTVSFKSTSAKKDDARKETAGALILTGDFTLHGRTRSVKLPVVLTVDADGRVKGEGAFKLKTSEYGIKPYSAFLGAVKVQDEIEIVITLIGVPK